MGVRGQARASSGAPAACNLGRIELVKRGSARRPGRGSRPAAYLLCSTLVLGASGCGSGSATMPTPNTNNLPPLSFSNVEINGLFITDVKVTITGTMIAVVDWTLASNDIEVYVTDPTCNETLAPVVRQSCTLLGSTNNPTEKPKRLTMNISPGIYRVFVANFGPAGAESGTVQISLQGH
jgi:hypothetical protein